MSSGRRLQTVGVHRTLQDVELPSKEEFFDLAIQVFKALISQDPGSIAEAFKTGLTMAIKTALSALKVAPIAHLI